MNEFYAEASEAELQVLKILWDQGTATVRELQQLLRKRRRRWAYNTVLTLLSRLREKGYVASDKQGTAYLFRATVSRDEMLRQKNDGIGQSSLRWRSQPVGTGARSRQTSKAQ
jgi:BlaI family transcriptional regulator, penicillinase repressor